MSNKKFKSFLENPQQLLLKSSKNGSTKRKVFKKDDFPSTYQIIKYHPKELANQDVDIYLLEEKEEVRMIQFKCKCGCQAAVKLVSEDNQEEAV